MHPENKLLPCPFCGGIHTIVTPFRCDKGWRVACDSCEAEVWGHEKNEAIANWQSRTPDTSAKVDVEREIFSRIDTWDCSAGTDCITKSGVKTIVSRALQAPRSDTSAVELVRELMEIALDMANAECEYMAVNNLGDGEKQHNVKRARKTITKAEQWLKNRGDV